MPLRPRRSHVALLLTALVSTLHPQNAAGAEPLEPDGYIVFSMRQQSEPLAIYGLRAGVPQTYLIKAMDSDLAEPVLSPDGTMIAFNRRVSGGYRLWVMRADGALARQLTSIPIVGNASWSPDGRHLVFGGEPGNDIELYTVTLDGMDLRQITDTPGRAGYPQWASTGRIYYYGSAALMELSTLHAVDPDGSNHGIVVDEPISGLAVSPDGTTLAYGLGVDPVQLHVGPADGGPSIQLTNTTGANIPRAFSPDGSRILFVSTRSTDYGLYFTISPDGADERELPTWIGSTPIGGSWGPRTFVDVGSSPFRDDIAWAIAGGITDGCWIAKFCPDEPITRGEMATFVARALDLPPATTDHFDDASWPHHDALESLAEAGILLGCAARRACPDALLTRGQAASVLARAFDLPPSRFDHFTDDAGYHEPDINRIASAGIAAGCGERRYCPNQPVTRGQMVAFLHRALR